MNFRGNRRRGLRVEPLEQRAMLAGGNVLANVAGGTLFIRGDAAENHVLVRQLTTSQYRIEGLAGTLVNGKAFEDLSGVSVNIDAQLGAGDDRLAISNDPGGLQSAWNNNIGSPLLTFPVSIPPSLTPKVNVPNAILVWAGEGNDKVAIHALAKIADVRGEGGNDELAVFDSQIRDFLQLGGGEGNNLLAHLWTTAGDARFFARSGGDSVRVNGAVFRNVLVDVGSGDDGVFFGNFGVTQWASIYTGDGEDRVELFEHAYVAWDLIIDTGIDDDSVNIEGIVETEAVSLSTDAVHSHFAIFDRNVFIYLGSGDDFASFDDVGVRRNVTIDAGKGKDFVNAFNVDIAQELFVYMGSGDDLLRGTSVRARRAFLYGGRGTDRYVAFNVVVVNPPPLVAEFELFV